MAAPLSGITVLDLSRIVSGPYCTMLLADLGALVVKVERPGQGDDTRSYGPPFLEGESAYFLSINRNKQSVTIDLGTSAGKEIAYRLARASDVVIENFRPGTADRLALGYDDLRAQNPALIYCSISGFGQTGPYRDRPGYDALAQAMSGMMSITGEPQGLPTKHGMSIADLFAGMWAALSILSALAARQQTGKGQYLDVSLLDTQLSLLTYAAGSYFAPGRNPGRWGSAHPSIVPYQPFRTLDGYLMLAVGNDALWRRFCAVAGRDDLAVAEGYATNPERVENREAVVAFVAGLMETRSTAEWVPRLEDAGVPAGPINTVEGALTDPHVLARDMVVDMEHALGMTVRMLGVPVKFSDTPAEIRTPPPTLGQHTLEVLLSLGYSEQDVELLRAEAVI